VAKNKRLTKITAGRLVRICVSSQVSRSDTPRQRAAKTKISTAARVKLNDRKRWEALEEIMACNFDRQDLFVTLTYANAPRTREGAMERLNVFLRRLRAARQARGATLRYIKNAEHLRDDGTEGRWHHHLIINGTGKDYEEIREIWSAWGDNVDFEGLLSNGESYETRARYMCKERPPAGRQCWTGSRGLRRPQRTSELVDESLTITIDTLPAGAVVLEKHEEHNEWGEFAFFKYLLPWKEPQPDPHRRRGD